MTAFRTKSTNSSRKKGAYMVSVSGNVSTYQFSSVIRKLNPRLRTFFGENVIAGVPTVVGSVYFWATEREWDVHIEVGSRPSQGSHWLQVCGISPVWMPERNVKVNGKMYKRGWREALDIIAQKGYIRIPLKYGGKEGILKHGHPREIVHGMAVGV